MCSLLRSYSFLVLYFFLFSVCPAKASPTDEEINKVLNFSDPAYVKSFIDKYPEQAVKLKVDKSGTLLFVASERGALEIVTLLLDKGAPIDERNIKGLTALMAAAHEGKVDVVNLLLARGADPTLILETGANALHWSSSVEVSRALLAKGLDIDSKDMEGYTPLFVASLFGFGGSELVRFYLDQGAAVNHRKNDGGTALHEASRMGRPDVVRALLAKGADPKLADNEGRTPLHYVAGVGRDTNKQAEVREVVDFLIAAGAEKDAKDHKGRTPEQMWSYVEQSFQVFQKKQAALKAFRELLGYLNDGVLLPQDVMGEVEKWVKARTGK